MNQICAFILAWVELGVAGVGGKGMGWGKEGVKVSIIFSQATPGTLLV